MNTLDKLREISNILKSHSIDDAGREAQIILTNALQLSVADIYSSNPDISSKDLLKIDKMTERRAAREPIQYILGCCEFMGMKLTVGKNVLVPRPETELMVEHAIKIINHYELSSSKQGGRAKEPLRVLDLCTGSGCIALSIAKEFPDSAVYGIDISSRALDYARENAVKNGIDNVSFLNGDLLQPLLQGEGFQLIVSNPPYIRTDDIYTLQPEVSWWEPVRALDGGTDGLEYYRVLIPEARKFLKDGGILMFELGDDCAESVYSMFIKAGYKEIELKKDYSGIKRIIQAKWTR